MSQANDAQPFDFRKALKGDRALTIAFATAAYAATVIDGLPDATAMGWPQIFTGTPEQGCSAARDVLAPFVRQWPDAPPDALYLHARDQRVHNGGPDAFRRQGLSTQFAYGLFSTVLVMADRAMAADQARREALQKPAPKPRPIPPDERTLTMGESLNAKNNLGKPSPIIPATPPPRDDELAAPRGDRYVDPRVRKDADKAKKKKGAK